jgi:hypothetical protein
MSVGREYATNLGREYAHKHRAEQDLQLHGWIDPTLPVGNRGGYALVDSNITTHKPYCAVADCPAHDTRNAWVSGAINAASRRHRPKHPTPLCPDILRSITKRRTPIPDRDVGSLSQVLSISCQLDSIVNPHITRSWQAPQVQPRVQPAVVLQPQAVPRCSGGSILRRESAKRRDP